METPEPPWLNSEEREAWLALMSLFMRLPSALDTQLQRDAGLSHFEYGILAGLSESPGRTLRMSVLAVLAEGSLARLSQAVGRLEKRGWTTRQSDEEDSRFTLAVLTSAGLRQLQEAAPSHVAAVREFVFDRLTAAQTRQLGAISQLILDGLPPDDSWPSPGK